MRRRFRCCFDRSCGVLLEGTTDGTGTLSGAGRRHATHRQSTTGDLGVMGQAHMTNASPVRNREAKSRLYRWRHLSTRHTVTGATSTRVVEEFDERTLAGGQCQPRRRTVGLVCDSRALTAFTTVARLATCLPPSTFPCLMALPIKSGADRSARRHPDRTASTPSTTLADRVSGRRRVTVDSLARGGHGGRTTGRCDRPWRTMVDSCGTSNPPQSEVDGARVAGERGLRSPL